jgi:hypothetical protein
MTITQSGSVTVHGNIVSGTNNDISITATSPTDPSVFARLYVTVVSVQVTMRNSGSPSPDDSAAQNYAKEAGNTLGPVIAVGGLSRIGPYCAEGIEYLGIVSPSNYQGTLVLRRTVTYKTYVGSQLTGASAPTDDTSNPDLRVDIPTTSGHIYDLDSPGVTAVGVAVPASNWASRIRQNFTEYAVLDSAKGTNTVGNSLQTFARTSCIGDPSTPSFYGDIPGDNISGTGTTPLSWNLQ